MKRRDVERHLRDHASTVRLCAFELGGPTRRLAFGVDLQVSEREQQDMTKQEFAKKVAESRRLCLT